MGKYAEPAMFVNKQYEQVNKNLSDMYSNVAKNAEQIKARELKKKQQAAKRMSDWNKIYAKGTQENYQGALDFTSAMPNDAINTIQFTNQLKSVYKQGYDNIAKMVASGASEGEIASYVQDQINAANTFTEGIVAFDNFQQRYNSGIEKIGQEAGDMKGNEVGDIVVGSQYNNTFTALGIDPGDEKVPLDRLKMVGDLNTGVKFFYDLSGDGELQEAEVLDLNTMAKNFSGGENPYFKEVEDFTEITKAYKSQLANLEKSPDFVREFSVTENGQTRKVTHVDRKKRQDYFLDENSDGGKLINEIIRTKDVTMLAQSIYGYKFAEQFDPTDPVQMKMLKVGLAEKLSPSLFPGSEKLAPSASDRTTVTRTYEDKSPEIGVIENFTRPIHEDVSGYAVNNSPRKLQDLNTKYAGRPFKTSKGNSYTTGIVDDISVVPGQSNQNLLQINYVVNGNTSVGMQFDLNTPEGMKAFETALVHGNFPNAKKERIDGTYDGLISGEGYDDSKSTTRVSNRKGTPTMTIEDFEEQISGSDDVISSKSLYESWQNNWAGANPSISASSGGTNVVSATGGGGNNIVTLPVVNQNQQGGSGGASTTTTTFQGLDVNNLSSYGPQATTSSQPNNSSYVFDFHGLEVEPTKFKSGYPPLQMKQDGKDYIRQIGNFETYAGSSTKGVGVEGYGFSGANKKLRDKFDNASGKDLDEKFINTVDTYIIGGNTPGKDVYGEDLQDVLDRGEKPDTSILTDLNMDRATFDALPDDVKKEIVDWKMNTGRSAADIVVIASGGNWDGDRGAASTLPAGELGKVDYKKLTGDNLLKARQDMYKGTLRLTKKKHGANSSLYKSRKKQYDNSQQYR